jgi:biotin carboxyl carrier protein
LNRKWCEKLAFFEIFIDGKPHRIELTKTGENTFAVKLDGRTVKAKLPPDKPDVEGDTFYININGKKYSVSLPKIEKGKILFVKVEEATFKAEIKPLARKAAAATYTPVVTLPIRKAQGTKQQVAEGIITAPMTGKILSVKVKKGETVKSGQILCILEAMKMENEIAAVKAGMVREVYVSEGSSVSEGEPLFLVD